MMIATVRASSPRCSSSTARESGVCSPSDLEDLGFLALQQLIDLLRVVVGELLDALLRAVLLVLADLALVDELLEVVDRVAADVAHCDAPLLGHPAHDLDELLAALLRELRDRQPNQLAVVRGRQAEVGFLNRPLDRAQRAWVERLDGDHPRLGRVDRGELLERRLLAVVVDLDAVEERRRRAARAQRRELGLRGLDGLVHPPLCVLNEIVDRHGDQGVETIVPTRSPSTTLRMFPGSSAKT